MGHYVPYIKLMETGKPTTGVTKMTKASKSDAVMNEMTARGFEWSMDLADAVRDALAVADGKDTARKIAGKVAATMKAMA